MDVKIIIFLLTFILACLTCCCNETNSGESESVKLSVADVKRIAESQGRIYEYISIDYIDNIDQSGGVSKVWKVDFYVVVTKVSKMTKSKMDKNNNEVLVEEQSFLIDDTTGKILGESRY